MPLVDSECQTDAHLPLLSNSSDEQNEELIHHHNNFRILHASKTSWMSKRMKKCLYLLLLLCVFGVVVILYLGYNCPETVCALSTTPAKSSYSPASINKILLETDQPGRPLGVSSRSESNPTYEEVVSHDFQFDISGHDVMVFLHIQKTGGTTFGKHLVRDLDLTRGCQCHSKIRKRCTCLRPGPHSSETWLFSRYSTGWQCGLHADWTELTDCVDETMDTIDDKDVARKYFYITFLRDPVHRFLSEYKHVKRGATWKNARLYCMGRQATEAEVSPCYSGEVWNNPSIEDFMNCEDNLARNRQTRMLADLKMVGCYNKTFMPHTKREELMLYSAKQNLQRMAFFGLTEEQEKSQYLFEEIFNLRFSVRFEQYNKTFADASLSNISTKTLDRIRELNSLDLQLYEYAQQLLDVRFNRLSKQDRHFHDHFNKMGKTNFSWEALEMEEK